MSSSSNNLKVIFIEWDGATWGVINRLLAQGRLPNLRRIMSRGISAVLPSESPMVSARLWTSIHSGKPPQRHGVEFFGATSRSVKCKRVWDIAEEHGLRVGIFGTLITWPPRSVNGFMIPDIFALGTETYPAEYRFLQEIALEQRQRQHQGNSRLGQAFTYVRQMLTHGVSLKSLNRILGYLAMEKIRRPGYLDRYWRKAHIHLRLTGEVFAHLYTQVQPHLATFHIHYGDAVSHRYWAFYEPEKFDGVPAEMISRFGEVIPQAYQEADRVIGGIAALADAQTTLIIASDHGFGPFTNTLSPYILNIGRLLKIMQLEEQAIPARFGLDTFLYFQDAGLMAQIGAGLAQVSLPEFKTDLFTINSRENYLEFSLHKQLRRAEIPEESMADFGPWGKYKFSEIFSKANHHISGIHHPEGILVMAGPGIHPGAKPDAPTIYDLAPTLLTSLGLPVAQDMYGRALKEIFTGEFLQSHPISYVPSYETQEYRETDSQDKPDYAGIKERLQSLGYL